MAETKAPAAKGGEKPKRVQPVFDIEPVDEIPPAPPSGANRAFYDGLVKVANEHKGKPIKYGVYSSPEGAGQVARNIKNGKRSVPGKLEDWTFEPRRTDTGSVMYVLYAADGPDIAVE